MNKDLFALKMLICLILVLAMSIRLKAQQLKITYIAHASFIISNDDTSLLIDPFADTTWIGYKFPKNIKADAALISHPHYDHDGGRFRGVKPYWEDQLEIIEDAGETRLGNFQITGLTGKHCDPYGKEFDQKNIIWKIEIAGLKIVHLGDNGPLTDDNYESIGTPDILFIPIDSDYHILKPDELAEVLDRLKPKVIIPMHYRHPDLEDDGFPKGGLGEIDPYLVGKNFQQLDGNTQVFERGELPEAQLIVVFRHSDDVVR